MFDLEFKIERLEKALGKLQDKHEIALSLEKKQALEARRAEGVAKQKALAKRFAEEYPQHASAISSTFQAVVELDREILVSNRLLGAYRETL